MLGSIQTIILTSVSIGYNIAQALAGGMSPFLATLLFDKVGSGAPGLLLFTLAVISMIGLRIVAPSHRAARHHLHPVDDISSIELKEIT